MFCEFLVEIPAEVLIGNWSQEIWDFHHVSQFGAVGLMGSRNGTLRCFKVSENEFKCKWVDQREKEDLHEFSICGSLIMPENNQNLKGHYESEKTIHWFCGSSYFGKWAKQGIELGTNMSH